MRFLIATMLVVAVPLAAAAQTPDLPRLWDDQLLSPRAEVQPAVWAQQVAGRDDAALFRTQVPFGNLPPTAGRVFHPDLYGNWIAFLAADDAGLSLPWLVTGTSEHEVDDWGVYRHPRLWHGGQLDGLRYVVAKQQPTPYAADWNVMWYAFDANGVAQVEQIGDDLRDQVDPAVWGPRVAWAEQTTPGPLGYEVFIADEGNFGSPKSVGPGRHPDVNENLEVVHETSDMTRTEIRVDGSPLGLEPFGECSGFHHPKWGGSRFVLFSGSGCLAATGRSYQLLYLADRKTGCTWVVDRLVAPAVHGNMMDAWVNEDDPAYYDIDEEGNIVWSSWTGPDWADFDIFYVVPDMDLLDKGC